MEILKSKINESKLKFVKRYSLSPKPLMETTGGNTYRHYSEEIFCKVSCKY